MAILMPGMMGTRAGPHRLLFDIAQVLADSGIPVARYDLRGCGQSDGHFEGTDFGVLLGDVQRIMDWHRETDGVTQFLLGGICLGAKLALWTALDAPRVRHVVLLSCQRPIQGESNKSRRHRRWRHVRQKISSLRSPRLLFKYVWNPVLSLRKALHLLACSQDTGMLQRFSPPPTRANWRRFSGDGIFLFAEKDPELAESQAYYQNAMAKSCAKVDFEVIPEADHGFYSITSHHRVLQKIGQWCVRQRIASHGSRA
jgi:pimeloyl-ACP methyl ester carboxylesterase